MNSRGLISGSGYRVRRATPVTLIDFVPLIENGSGQLTIENNGRFAAADVRLQSTSTSPGTNCSLHAWATSD